MFWNKKPKVERLFGSWPPTEINKNKVRIKADFFTPGRKSAADGFQGLLGLAGAYFGFVAAEKEGQNPLVGGGIGAVIGAWIGEQAKNNFKKTLEVEFNPDFIRIPSGWGFKNYDLKQQHGFNMELHELAEGEQETEEDERYKKGGTHRKPKLYRNSFNVFMEFFGERIYLAEVYDKKLAQALLLRLQGVDQYVKTLDQSNVEEPVKKNVGSAPPDKTSPFGERPPLDD